MENTELNEEYKYECEYCQDGELCERLVYESEEELEDIITTYKCPKCGIRQQG